jgi:hypothetical protein
MALEKGAEGCLCAKVPDTLQSGKFYVQVADTTVALRDLAAHYRARFDIPVVQVSGSAGKTTTKEMIYAVLSRAFRTMKKHKLSLFMLGLLVSVLVITAIDVMWSPYLLERYRMDIYFLMGIGTYLAVGIWYESVGGWFCGVIASASVLLSGGTVLTSFLLALYRVNVSSPHRVAEVAAFLGLGG